MRVESTNKNTGYKKHKTIIALKAARLSRELSRTQAASLCGISYRSFEQIENGRCNFTEARIRRLVELMGVSWSEFQDILDNPYKALNDAVKEKPKERSLSRKPRRNSFKIITKEVRVIRALRKRKGMSQYEASRLCGYSLARFGHIEAGRIELKKTRIDHILKSLGFTWDDFNSLMNAALLRDEIIEDTTDLLHRLDDQALSSAVTVIKALIK